MGNKNSKQFNSAVALLNKLSTDLKYHCLVFLDKYSYYAITKVLGIPLKIKYYYNQCENELLNNDWKQYYKLCKSFNIPLKLHEHNTHTISTNIYHM